MAEDQKDATPESTESVAEPALLTHADIDATAKASMGAFLSQLAVILKEFTDYRAKAQSGHLTADDEKRAGLAIEHLGVIIDGHKPLPSLPHLLQ